MSKTMAILTLGALLVSSSAWAAPYDEENQLGVSDEKNAEAGPRFPVSALVIFDNSFGAGALVSNQYARNVAWVSTLSLRPTLTLWSKLRLTLRTDVSKNLASSYQDSDTYIRQTQVSDISLIASLPQIFHEEVTGITLGASLSAYAPISMQSREANLVTALRPGLNLSWSWAGLRLGYGLFYKQYFHTTTNRTQNVAALPNSLLFRSGGAEDLGDGEIAIGSRNTQSAVYNSMNASYTFLDKWSTSVSLMVVSAFKYTQALSDQYSSPYASATGQSDMTSGGLDLSYQATEHLAFSIGVSSLQPLRSADNKSLRFPFYDFVTPGNNFSAFYFDVVGSL